MESQQPLFFAYTSLYTFVHPITGIFNVDGEKWKQQRKMISRMFSANEFRNTMANAFKVHAEPLRRVRLGCKAAGSLYS